MRQSHRALHQKIDALEAHVLDVMTVNSQLLDILDRLSDQTLRISEELDQHLAGVTA